MGVPPSAPLATTRAAILGIPFDCGTDAHRIGARQGPEAIRRQSHLLRPFDPETGLNPLAALSVVDVGDADVRPGRPDESLDAIAAAVHALASAGIVPVSLGGDGAVALPEMRALHRTHPDLVTVHIDAHTDAYPLPGLNTATPFARAVEEGVIDATRSFHIGLRGQTMIPGVYAHARHLGYRVIPMAELLREGIAAVFARVASAVGDRPVYLCYDMDFFDPAVAPGVCTPTWGGASAREGLEVLAACEALNIVGLNVNTISPAHDVNGMSAMLAGQVALNGLGVIARQRQM